MKGRAIRYFRLFPVLLLFALPALLSSVATSTACSGPVPFFVYGGCDGVAKGKDLDKDAANEAGKNEDKVATLRPARQPFTPVARVWRVSTDRRGDGHLVSTSAVFADQDGVGGEAQFTIRCRDDRTSAWFRFAGYEMGNRGAQREIVYQVDEDNEEIVELERARNHEILTIQRGYRAVPFVRRLIGGQSIRISAIAANGKELRAVLPLEGLDRAIRDLRTACHW